MTGSNHSFQSGRDLSGSLFFILTAAALVGCAASPASARTERRVLVSVEWAAPDDSAHMPITKGMAYAEARRKLLSSGWSPLEDLTCYDNVYGDTKPPAGKNICEAMPELSSASGDGHLMMHMIAPDGQTLAIYAYGDMLKWNMPGQETALVVTDWEIY